MYKIFGTCVGVTYLAVTPFVLAQSPPTTMSLAPGVTISVHDYADVPRPQLAGAEAQASTIFRHAGLEMIWFNCGPRVEDVESEACYMSGPTHLILNVLPHPVGPQVRDRNDVLGGALLDEQGIGYHAYVFYDRVRNLADRRGLGSELLGVVFAHEIGHLLLGSKSHSVSGIMCARWKDRELLNISEGVMSFLPAQSSTMRDRLNALQTWTVGPGTGALPVLIQAAGSGARNENDMFKPSLAVSALSWSAGDSFPSGLSAQEPSNTTQVPSPEDLAAETPLSGLDLPATPPSNAYAVTGELLPPFLKAVLSDWNQEFGATPLSNNSIIFVIRPEQFYSGLEVQQRAWLMSREMLGIRNFPVIVNPLTPNDDWYQRAQDEWQKGNPDAVDVVLTSLFHEMAHTQRGWDEGEAYRGQLVLFERFRKQGRLSSSYAHTCYDLLRSHYRELTRHPERYRRVSVNIQDQSVALLVRAQDAPLNTVPVGHK